MEQHDALPVRDIYQALEYGCRAIAAAVGPQQGKAWAKHVGSILFVGKDPEDAATYLNNCLDRDRKEKLDTEHIFWIVREAKRVGCHLPMAFVCDYTGYQRTSPVVVEDEKAELQRQFNLAMRTASELVSRMERLHDAGKPGTSK